MHMNLGLAENLGLGLGWLMNSRANSPRSEPIQAPHDRLLPPPTYPSSPILQSIHPGWRVVVRWRVGLAQGVFGV